MLQLLPLMERGDKLEVFFINSKYLQSLPQCQVTVRKNEYVIRTQPEEGFVSTLEALAAAVASAEQNEDLYSVLTSEYRS